MRLAIFIVLYEYFRSYHRQTLGIIIHILHQQTNRRINMTHFARRRNVNHFFFNKMSSCHFGEARRYMNSQRFKSGNKLVQEVITKKKISK